MKILTFLLISALCLSINIYSAWFTQTSGTNAVLNSVYFPALSIGYIAGNSGTILKTVDKGASWQALNSGTQRNLTSVFFLDINNGYAVGDNIILKTNNGGGSWNIYTTSYVLKSVHFVNSQTGFTAGYNGVVLKTVNGGASWNTIIPGSQSANYTSVFFSNPSTGYIVGLGGRCLKTIDGGATWEQKPTSATKNFYSVQFLDENTGYIAGGWVISTIMKSQDGGESWNSIFSSLDGVRLFSSSFIDVDKGLVAGRNGMIMRTQDAGNTWTEENSGTNVILYDVHFLNPQTAYAIGENGTILATISVIGINQISSNIPEKFSLSQNYPNPFNPTTKVRFDIAPLNLPEGEKRVTLKIYDLLGREVAILVNEELKPGTYEADFDGSRLPSGTYFYRLQTSSYTETKKMVLLK